MAGEISLAEEMRRRAAQSKAASQPRPGVDRPVHSVPAQDSAEPVSDTPALEGEVHATAYGYYRGVRERAGHIEIQRLQGSWPAPGYAWLPCPVWAPAGTGQGRGQVIILEFVTGLKVTIRGRNLRRLYESLLRQQVFRITEMGEDVDRFLPEGETVVYAIEVKEPEEERR